MNICCNGDSIKKYLGTQSYQTTKDKHLVGETIMMTNHAYPLQSIRVTVLWLLVLHLLAGQALATVPSTVRHHRCRP
jgi:hypothetical protein